MLAAPPTRQAFDPPPAARARRLDRAWWLGLLLVLVLGVVIKEPELLLPIGPDQGTYSYVAERILAGGLPYVDAWDNKPPATYYAHAAVLALVPAADCWSRSCLPGVQQECGYLALQLADVVWTSGYAALQTADLIWTAVTALAVLAVARALGFSALGSLSSMVLFSVFANLSQLSKEGSTPEKQLLLPMTLAYLCALRGTRRWLVVAGALAGVAFLFKQTAVTIHLELLA